MGAHPRPVQALDARRTSPECCRCDDARSSCPARREYCHVALMRISEFGPYGAPRALQTLHSSE